MRERKPLHWRKTWTKKQQLLWSERIDFLNEALDFSGEVHVHRIPMVRNFGDCCENGNGYLVRICNTLTFDIAVYILLHEMAHALEPNDHKHSVAFHDALRRLWEADEAYEDVREYNGVL